MTPILVRPHKSAFKMAAKMNDTISKLESIIGYHCTKDQTLLREALQAAGSFTASQAAEKS
jgi:hypothetical protein